MVTAEVVSAVPVQLDLAQKMTNSFWLIVIGVVYLYCMAKIVKAHPKLRKKWVTDKHNLFIAYAGVIFITITWIIFW